MRIETTVTLGTEEIVQALQDFIDKKTGLKDMEVKNITTDLSGMKVYHDDEGEQIFAYKF